MMNEVTLLDPPQLDRLLGNVDPEDMPDTVDELKTMHERLEQSPGQQYHSLFNDLSRSKQMLDDNYADLINAFDHFENNPGTWMADDEEQAQNALMDFTRKLHNYLAMCLSLRDHTYRVKDKLDRDDLDEQYSATMDELDLVPPASFIIKLRNYMQHRRIPVVTGRTSTHAVSGGPTERTAKILFDKTELLEWDGWDTASHEVLDELDDEFQIRSVIENYHATLTEFYHWLSEYLSELHTDEIEERDELVIKMAKKQEELFPGINEDFLNEEQS
ncbi:hypothetical protein GCM10008995_25360 [Halobellus salinus]|uniref:Uncharacterized protein n=2 Tax=Halobellus salinus TaxID=931585 RepID=A0A830EDB3_9EURY|nr:hypothetical protein GCM10008995_25360 [Halobellus salinus]